MGLLDTVKRYSAPVVNRVVEALPDTAHGVLRVLGQAVAPVAAVTASVDPVLVPALDHLLPRVRPSLRRRVWVATDLALVPNILHRPALTGTGGRSPTTTGNAISTLVDGPAYKAALLDRIRHATTSIWLESFQWQDNATGREVAQAIIDRKRAVPGLDVRIVYDNRTTPAEVEHPISTPPTEPAFFADMRAAGCDVRRTAYAGMRVNHRKLSVFDGATTFIGGQNLGDSYLLAPGGQYHDTTQMLTGPAARDAAAVFNDSWVRAGGAPLTLPARAPAQTGTGSQAEVAVISHSGGLDRNIERELIQRIDAENGQIVLANGFGMSDAIAAALIRARGRGAQVQWLWGNASHVSALMAQESFARLRAAGVEIHRYGGPLHMKAYYFRDTDYTIQGSSNLDGFSTFLNDEAVVKIHGGGVPADVYGRVLGPDLAASPLITGSVAAATSKKEDISIRTLERIADAD